MTNTLTYWWNRSFVNSQTRPFNPTKSVSVHWVFFRNCFVSDSLVLRQKTRQKCVKKFLTRFRRKKKISFFEKLESHGRINKKIQIQSYRWRHTNFSSIILPCLSLLVSAFVSDDESTLKRGLSGSTSSLFLLLLLIQKSKLFKSPTNGGVGTAARRRVARSNWSKTQK